MTAVRAPILACLLLLASSPLLAMPKYRLHEETSRFFPGTYFFHKGCDAFARGDHEGGVAMWKIAASWGQKAAQYDLGIAYFEGKGVAADRPRGLAWLALAAERKDPAFEESLALAWRQSSESEHDRANALWRELRGTYADDVALKRAHRRYVEELRSVTGARTGHFIGNMLVWTNEGGVQDASVWLADIEEQADTYFGTATGSVRIGPLEAVETSPSGGESDDAGP